MSTTIDKQINRFIPQGGNRGSRDGTLCDPAYCDLNTRMSPSNGAGGGPEVGARLQLAPVLSEVGVEEIGRGGVNHQQIDIQHLFARELDASTAHRGG